MPIKKIEIKMKSEDKKLILNYLKDPKTKKEMLKEKIAETQNDILESKVKFGAIQKRYETAKGGQTKEIYLQEMKNLGDEIDERTDFLTGFKTINELYRDMDIALISLEPKAYKAVNLYYEQGLSYKELTKEFDYSIQYIRNLILGGLNEIYEHLDKAKLERVKNFLSSKI